MAGRSLLPAIQGDGLDVVPVISEYHGEGVMRPCFMVRLGPWKLIYIHGAEAQLFNLDPDEWDNLTGRPEARDVEAELLDIITGGSFDLEFIARDVWDRLPQKAVVNQAMRRNATNWNYRPDGDAAGPYLRT